MTKLRFDVLDKNRLEFWEKLGTLSHYGCVLGGGTAIALQIGHRVSLDFDVFLKKEISSDLRKKLFSILDRPVVVELDTSEQLTLVSNNGIKVTLLYYPFPALHPPVKTDSLPLFNLRDLASSKAYTIGRRGTWRDYVDMYFLLKKKYVSLNSVVHEAEQRFGDESNPKLFLQQLTYTQDLGEFGIDFVREKVTPYQIVNFFEKSANKYLQNEVL